MVLAIGEQMAWNVFWQGVQIGRAELYVGMVGARSTFTTTAPASAFPNIVHDLSTDLGYGPHHASFEYIVHDGETRRQRITFDGARYELVGKPSRLAPGGAALHTLHTALGAVRAWSRTDARRAYLWLVVDGELYRVDLEHLARDRAALRIESKVRRLAPGFEPLHVTIWLADTDKRTPVRLVVVSGEHRISAELAEYRTKVI